MTLRADITSAYDEIAPPPPHLEAQIRTSVFAEARVESRSRRRGPWLASLRGTMALVAAMLVVLIVATVLIGGRVWHDWTIFNNRPAPAGQIDPVQLAALEARPLHLPVVPAGGTCPVGPFTNLEIGNVPLIGFGSGPAYGTDSHSGPVTAWGSYYDVTLVTEPQVTGWLLVRGRDAVNHTIPVAYVGAYAAGAVIGTDTIDGVLVAQHAELLVDASHHPAATSGKSGWGIWRVRQGIQGNDWSGCTAFQIDGNGFSAVFVG